MTHDAAPALSNRKEEEAATGIQTRKKRSGSSDTGPNAGSIVRTPVGHS